jgi:hypothetical protein
MATDLNVAMFCGPWPVRMREASSPKVQCQELEVSGRLSSGFGSFAVRGMCERDLR